MKISKAARLIRFSVFSKHIGIQGPVFHRPTAFYRYNDGQTAFIDLGPIRLYRHFWRESR